MEQYTFGGGGTIKSGIYWPVIWNNGNCTITSGNIIGASGGATTVENNGTLNILGGLITSNANWTLYNSTSGTTTMTGGEIRRTGNDDVGTAINSLGALYLHGGKITSVVYGVAVKAGASAMKDMTIETTGTYPALSLEGGIGVYVWNSYINAPIAAASYDNSGLILVNCVVNGSLLNKVCTLTSINEGAILRLYGQTTTENVNYYTWTENNGQDDIKAYESNDEITSNGTAKTVYVYKANHNNESGTYITHIYYTSWEFIAGFSFTL